MDKIAKIWSQSVKYILYFAEASIIINSVTQYRITKNYNRHIHCSSLIIIHY